MTKSLVPEDFKLSDRGYKNLCKYGAIPEFVDYEMEMFLSYFLDPKLEKSKALKSSWDMTCQRWMRNAWSGKAGRDWEYNRHKRAQYDSGGFTNATEAMGALMSDKPLVPQRRFKVPTAEESIERFKQLAANSGE